MNNVDDILTFNISREEYRLLKLIRNLKYGKIEVSIVNNRLIRAAIITNVLFNKPSNGLLNIDDE